MLENWCDRVGAVLGAYWRQIYAFLAYWLGPEYVYPAIGTTVAIAGVLLFVYVCEKSPLRKG